MAFTSKPGKPLQRTKAFQTNTALKTSGMKQGGGMKTAPPSPAEQRKAQQKSLQNATLRALEKARHDAATSGVELSPWESDFIEGVAERVKTYGRAFADPDKGAMNGTLSLRQGVKLNEIRKKARKAKPDA
ncbi:hypothetical protein ABI_32760 [Asticcacaulis biprosthecium C19]|uniref:Uncharacterized protein n=1 Tax=Asticcacaulis biprosthecium C19 TaxID=715226 RepID=F4QPX3_9CAUL|nr:hypothetical protein [Asticcacaulis biprosthecium]EGF90260.1 hypothetical protein ABI_32760 [Asticcacaulis biprosthecium C19]